jgi:hypothetical protein
MAIPRRPDLPSSTNDRGGSRRERAISVVVLGGVAVLLGVVAVVGASRTSDTADDRILGATGVHRYHRGDTSIVEVSYREPGVVTQSRLIWQNGFFYRVDAATRGRPADEVELFLESFHPL